MTLREAGRRGKCNSQSLSAIGIPAIYHTADFKSMQFEDKEKRKIIMNYMKNIHDMQEEQVSLLFYGSNGSGKSYLASIIAREAYMNYMRVGYFTMAELMTLRFSGPATESDHYKLRTLEMAHMLVIDEVGKENFTKTRSNIVLLEDIMRQAVSKGIVLIMITNMTLEALYKQYGTSIESLIDGSFVKLLFDGTDFRKQVLQSKPAIKKLMEG